MATISNIPTPARAPKEEGSIASLFTSLTGEPANVLPQRFADLKRELWDNSAEALDQSWREVLGELEKAVEEVSKRGPDMIPRINYADIRAGLSEQNIAEIKRAGTVIVAGGVPKEEALAWKQSIRDYAAANSERVKGFPPENVQVFELYNSVPQLQARTHPAVVNTQKFLLSLWHASDSATEASLDTPISYFDRLRIRQPGDAKFTLGPHVDGGSVERWEDHGYREVFAKILQGGSGWREHDSFNVTPRTKAKQDLYNASYLFSYGLVCKTDNRASHFRNQCSIYRSWQGWTSMSSTGPNEGTLRVLPLLHLASAYIVLRPFFRPKDAKSTSLKAEDWEVDLEGTAFPGSAIGKTQELNELTHPHLRLDKTMVSMPKVEPGDQVYWHCDLIHAVESQHRGTGDSSVMYIPAVPLTIHNAEYLRDQRTNFLAGLPAPDFPGGEGETKFIGRATETDVDTLDARRLLGLEPFDTSSKSNSDFIRKVNSILF